MNSDLNDVDVRPDERGASDEAAPGESPAAGQAGSGERDGGTAAEAGDLAHVIAEREALRDRLLRTTAEFDNFRKRIERDRREMIERAAEGVLADLLPIVDNLERALEAEAGTEGAEAYRRGVELIHKQLLDLLAGRGVTAIDALGADFDPHLHQAVASEPAEGRRDGEVIEVFRTGYLLGDRLLRAAMVKVAKA